MEKKNLEQCRPIERVRETNLDQNPNFNSSFKKDELKFYIKEDSRYGFDSDFINNNLNLSSIEKIIKFMSIAGIPEVIFYGGALLNNKTREGMEVADYDFCILNSYKNDSNYRTWIENATKSDLFIRKGERIFEKCPSTVLTVKNYDEYQGIAASTITTNLNSSEEYEFAVKKNLNFGTWNIDNFKCKIKCIEKDNYEVSYIKNKKFEKKVKTLEQIKSRVLVINDKRAEYHKVLKRFLVLTAKYEIRFNDKENSEALKIIEQKKKKYKLNCESSERAACLDKFMKVFVRIPNFDNYMKDLEDTNILRTSFPSMCNVLFSNEFKSFLKMEQANENSKRKMNAPKDFIRYTFQCAEAENRKKLLDEYVILLDRPPEKLPHGVFDILRKEAEGQNRYLDVFNKFEEKNPQRVQ